MADLVTFAEAREHLCLDADTGIRLLEKYIARQTVQPSEWIVSDDGDVPAMLTMGQTHIVRPRTVEGGASLAQNILAALDRVTGDVIVIAEHDDHYQPNHIEVQLQHLRDGKKAAGSIWQRYYNVATRQWIVMRNVGSALCNTAFTADLIPKMRSAADSAARRNVIGMDRMFWDSLPPECKAVHRIDTVVGIKGLPGRKGLGLGHRPEQRAGLWSSDSNGEKLREWVGEDAVLYG